MKARLAAGERLSGALVRMPCEEVVEMLGVAGLDFVLVDCEHGPADVGMLRSHLVSADAHGLPMMVRVGEDEHRLAQRALDLGARGIVAPHVESTEQARELSRALRYPPHGSRGFATYPRAGGFGSVTPAAHRAAAESVLVLAMLESPGAIARAGEIVDVPGIDGYLVGPADLEASRTHGDPPTAQLLDTVHAALRSRATVRADLAGSADAAAASFADGAHLVVHNLTAVMMRSFRALADATPGARRTYAAAPP